MPKCMICMQDYDQQDFCPFCGAPKEPKPLDMGQIPEETILNRRFIIGEVVNVDRIGFLYNAWDALLERKVLIKEWYPKGLTARGEDHLKADPEMNPDLWEELCRQFSMQAERLHKLQDLPILLPIYMVFQENNTVYYVMEYQAGTTLREMLQRENPMPPKKAEGIMNGVREALAFLKKQNLVHGNLTPDNIFFSENGEIKFLNLAWFSKEMETIRYTVFQGRYAPPAYSQLPLHLDEAIDEYSLNAIFYRLLSGEEPVAAVNRRKKEKMYSISELGISVPAALEKKIMKGLGMEGGKGLLRFFQGLNGVLVLAAVILGVMIFV